MKKCGLRPKDAYYGRPESRSKNKPYYMAKTSKWDVFTSACVAYLVISLISLAILQLPSIVAFISNLLY